MVQLPESIVITHIFPIKFQPNMLQINNFLQNSKQLSDY